MLKLATVAFLVFAAAGFGAVSALEGRPATVSIYAPRGDPGRSCTRVFPLQRAVRKPAVLEGAMRALLAGPTRAERRRGYGGWFSARTAGYLRSVRIRGAGVAYVDFRNFSKVIPNASASCGSALLLAQLNRTATQFHAVRRAVYSFNGSARAFYEWLQRPPPSELSPRIARSTAGSARLPNLKILRATIDRVARTVDLRLRVCFSPGPRAAISVSERRALRGVAEASSSWTVPRAVEPTHIDPFSCRTGWRVNWLLKPRLTGPGTYTATIRVRDAYGRWTPPTAVSVTSP